MRLNYKNLEPRVGYYDAEFEMPATADETTIHMPETEQHELLTDITGECHETASEAFDVIVTHYHEHAVRHAYLHLQDMASAEDLVQDIWGRIWEKRDTLNVGSRFWMYLKKCIKNAVMRVARDAEVRKTDVTDMSPASLDNEPTWEPAHADTPDSLAIQAEVKAAVHATLEQLKPEQAELLRRVEFDGISLKAYAAEIGVKYPTMKRRKQAAVQAMQTAFITDYPELAARFSTEA